MDPIGYKKPKCKRHRRKKKKKRNYKLFKTSWETEREDMRACISPRDFVHSVEIVPKTKFMFCLNVLSIMSLEKYLSETHAHITNLLIPMMKPLNLHFCSAVPV